MLSATRIRLPRPSSCTHFVSVSTLRAALDLKSTFEALQAAEKNGNLTPEQRKKLEEQAAEKGLDALFKVSLLLSRFCS